MSCSCIFYNLKCYVVSDPPHMDEVDSKGFTSVVGGQPLIVEETIKPVKAATSGSVRKRLTRSDNFRKLIKKRSLKDDDKDQVKADASAANDNEMNDLLESKQKTVRAQETSGVSIKLRYIVTCTVCVDISSKN